MKWFWWLWWLIISGDGWCLSFPDICVTVEEKPQVGKLTWPGIEPGPARWEVPMLHLDHSGGHIHSSYKLKARIRKVYKFLLKFIFIYHEQIILLFLDYLLSNFYIKYFFIIIKTLFINSLLLWRLVSVEFDHFQALGCRSIHVNK